MTARASPSQSFTAPPRPTRARRMAPLLLVLVTLAAYHNSLGGPFIFDDNNAIIDNRHIRRLWPITEALGAEPGRTLAGRPLVSLSFAVNYAVGELNVRGYHLSNLLIHVLAALTLFGLVSRTLRLPALRGRYESVADGLALAVAMLWAVHPLLTESITYVSNRTESLMGLFFLLAMYGVARGLDSPRARWWQAGAVACALLAVASKEVAAAIPLVALCYDRLFGFGSWREALRRRWIMYVGLAATWLFLAALLYTSVDLYSKTGGGAQWIGPWSYALTQAAVLTRYLRLALWPYPLSIDYSDWPVAHSPLEVLPQALLVLALLAVTVWGLARARPWSFLGCWFFLILAPTSSFLPLATEVAAERRMYLPLAAVVALIVFLVHRLLAGAQHLKIALTGAAAIALAAGTVWRNQDYSSAVSIWADTVAKRPLSSRARANLGQALHQIGESAAAKQCFIQAIDINPNEAHPHSCLGLLLLDDGDVDQAVQQFRISLRLTPGDFKAHHHLATALSVRGEQDAAIKHFREALRLKGDFAPAHNGLGHALSQTRQADEAFEHFERAIGLDPNLAGAHRNMGTALASIGRLPQAVTALMRAVELDPGDAVARHHLGMALSMTGEPRGAVRELTESIRLKPDQPQVLGHLAWILANHPDESVRDQKRAVALARRACELTGNESAVALDTLGAAYASAGQIDQAIEAAERAKALAEATGQRGLVDGIAKRLERYESRRGPLKGAAPTEADP